MDALITTAFLSPSTPINDISGWKDTFTGLHFPADLTTPEITLTHERLLKAKYWHVGGGGAYALSRKTEIGADVVFFVAGSDTHYGTGLAVHISRSFEFMKKQSPGIR
ncbi:MAG TPA: hypothetical protein VJR26_04675 [Candidatus Acidoferrales bacterium]|nr:hypothetical protein [Candidatus Acidoferrales bacterium]